MKKIEEIRSEDWGDFCEKFTEFNRESLLTIEVIGKDGIRSEIVSELPLDKMTFDTTDACNNVISISLGTKPDQRKTNHFIIDPVHLRIRQMEAGKKILEIAAENGTNLVTFHSGRFPQTQFSEEKRFAIPS
jgi:hypothetical protein